MLATSSCLYAGIGRELLLVVSNYRTFSCISASRSSQSRTAILVKLVANIQYFIAQNGEVEHKIFA